MSVIECNALMRYKDASGNTTLIYPITKKENVDGLDEFARNQSVTTSGTGSAYTAIVEGITSLVPGVRFTMIPNVDSTSSSPTLDVNGLGAKRIRRRIGVNNDTTSAGGSDDWLTAGKPIDVIYDGTFWISDLQRPYAPDIMGTVSIQNGGTGATTAEQARINLGIETTNGTVTSGNADYAEVGQWTDGNPDDEDRIGYFVCVDLDNPGIIMKKATIDDDVRGVTVVAPAFSGGCSDDKFDENGALLPSYDYVAVMGIVPVIDNGTCTVGGRCIPGSDSTAVPVSGTQGYQVMERIDDTHVLIAVEPGADRYYHLELAMNELDSKHRTFTVTVTANDWVGDTAPYIQTIAVTDILETDVPHYGVVFSGTNDQKLAQKESFGYIDELKTEDGVITFTCLENKPTVDITIQMEANR